VLDSDLAGASITVSAASDSEPAGETVTLNLTDDAGVYEGSIATSDGAAAGVLTVADGDTVTVTYIDADDGNGGVNVPKTDSAFTDCVPPTFGGLTDAEAGDYRVTLTWQPATDINLVSYNVYRSESSGDYNWNEPLANASDSPYVDKNAPNGVTYYYVVRAVDAVGNADDNLLELSAKPEGPDRLLRETFDAKAFDDWTVTNRGCPGAKWTTDNERGRASDLFEGLFILSDAGACIMGSADSIITSPAIDTHHYSGLQLRFAHSFAREFQERGHVQYSIDGGATWTDVTTFNKRKEAEEAFDLPAECEGIDALQVRFEFQGGGLFDGWWGIDTIEITGLPGAADDDNDDASPDDDTADDDAADDDDDDNDDNDSGDDDDDDDAADDDSGDDDDDSGGCGC
jgi:hypothetical protein